MFYWWRHRLINGSVSLLIFLGAIYTSLPSPTLPGLAQASGTSNPASQPTPEIDNTTARILLFLPVTTNLGFRPPIELKTVQTGDGAGNAKYVFLPGEPIEYRLEVANNTNATKSVTVRWVEASSCGEVEIINETVKIRPGAWERVLTGTTPDCQGVALNAIDAVDGTEILTYSFNHIVTTPFQGFDKCTLPSVAQMQTWWDSSPYWTFNVYVGGVSLACRDSNLNINWLRSVSQQGWTFIPTWVGPQAPCTGFNHRMSANPTTALQQGRLEAEAAVAAVSQLGLLGNRIIYYDLEGYASKATDACRQAVAAFMQGWVERLHELDFSAGAYGGACSSFAADWAENASPPDNVWLAHWYRSSWYKYASVWNTPCVANGLWGNHQRLKQYAGDHNETWGGVTFRIDSSVLDGTVASFQEVQRNHEKSSITASLNSGPGKDSPLDAIEAMQLLAPGEGWALIGDRLFVTRSGGDAWQDVTPDPLSEGEILGVYFKDPGLGWLAGLTPEFSGEEEFIVLRTEDGGLTWSQLASPPSTPEIQPIAAVYPYFLDAQSGWIALKIQSSVNFSLGRLFFTQDGGQSWEELSLPLGEPVVFVDAHRGWVAGGPRGDELFRTDDGGRSWQPQTLPDFPLNSAGNTFVSLPEFAANGQGLLPVTISSPEDSTLLLYVTRDQGQTWELSQSIELDSQAGHPPVFSLQEDGQWWAAAPGRAALITKALNGSVVVQTVPNLTGNLIALDFTIGRNGWAITQEGDCTGNKPKIEEMASSAYSPLICRSESILWATEDAGRSWKEITPLP